MSKFIQMASGEFSCKSEFSIPVLCRLSVNLIKIIYSKLLMNYNVFTFQENTNVQYHLIPQPKEVTDMSFYGTSCHCRERSGGRGFFDALQIAYLFLDVL